MIVTLKTLRAAFGGFLAMAAVGASPLLAAATFITQPASATVAEGGSVTLSATVSTTEVVDAEWQLNGVAVDPYFIEVIGLGADMTDPAPGNGPVVTPVTLPLSNVSGQQAGVYTLVIFDGATTITSDPATLTVTSDARLTNLSARANVGVGDDVLIVGFGISGTGPKKLLLRGAGPALQSFGVTAALGTPALTLFDNTNTAVATDLAWGLAPSSGPSLASVTAGLATAGLMNQLGAFPFAPGSGDSAMAVSAPPGNYSPQIGGITFTSPNFPSHQTTGLALAEVYDADAANSTARLVNLSGRAYVGAGDNILIGGFAISGTTSESVLIRAIGPGLATTFGLGETLAAPRLILSDAHGHILFDSQPIGVSIVYPVETFAYYPPPNFAAIAAKVGAFPLPPSSADIVEFFTLPPGGYTAQVSGADGGSGLALLEVYEVR